MVEKLIDRFTLFDSGALLLVQGTLVLKSRQPASDYDGYSRCRGAFSAPWRIPRKKTKNEIRLVVNALPGVVWTTSLEGPLR